MYNLVMLLWWFYGREGRGKLDLFPTVCSPHILSHSSRTKLSLLHTGCLPWALTRVLMQQLSFHTVYTRNTHLYVFSIYITYLFSFCGVLRETFS